jgi:hypothetical protein
MFKIIYDWYRCKFRHCIQTPNLILYLLAYSGDSLILVIALFCMLNVINEKNGQNAGVNNARKHGGQPSRRTDSNLRVSRNRRHFIVNIVAS